VTMKPYHKLSAWSSRLKQQQKWLFIEWDSVFVEEQL
jgi:hypothetical protein